MVPECDMPGRDERPWFKLTTEYPRHRKIRGLTDRAFRLHITLLALCADEKNDGMILPADLNMYGPKHGKELLDAGLVHKDAGRYIVHDYTAHQTPAEQVKASQEEKRQNSSYGGLKGTHNRWHVKRSIVDPDCPLCQGPPNLNSPGPSPF